MPTGNWAYDNLMARRQAQEMARAFEKQNEPRIEYREGFSGKTVAWVFILGVFAGAFLASGGAKLLGLH